MEHPVLYSSSERGTAVARPRSLRLQKNAQSVETYNRMPSVLDMTQRVLYNNWSGARAFGGDSR